MIFVQSLEQKAIEVGLNQDALIPQETTKEKQIY